MKKSSFLITGNDLVGKTTLINNLVPYLRSNGFKIISNKNDLYKTDLTKCIQALLKKDSSEDLLQINSLFLVSFLVDSLKFKPEPDVILIQDSYAFRTIAFCYANQLTIVTELFEMLKHRFFNFDVTIHLTASIECRKQRLATRSYANSQDNLIITDINKVRRMDYHLNKIVQTHKQYIQLDTTKLTTSDVFEQVVSYVNKFT